MPLMIVLLMKLMTLLMESCQSHPETNHNDIEDGSDDDVMMLIIVVTLCSCNW